MTKSRRIKVGIFFGGRSAEHEVSVQSAKNVLQALDTERFDPILIGIDKSGVWHLGNGDQPENLSVDKSGPVCTLLPGKGDLITETGNKLALDVTFPALHGPFGEDGTIQGMFETVNLPYVGPNVLGSAVGMDKDFMKRLLRDAGTPIAPFLSLNTANKSSLDPDQIFHELGSTVFVKPANMGSSVGVSRATNSEELEKAVATAFEYDTKIIIEKMIIGDEIECSVIGNNKPEASLIGRIIPKSDNFYSYDAKYIDSDGAILEIPADLPKDASDKARELAIKTFQVLGCSGMGRVDMFVTKDGEIFVNEINTIPGFTKISMYPKLWEASGLTYKELISKLIDLAIERHETNRMLSVDAQ